MPKTITLAADGLTVDGERLRFHISRLEKVDEERVQANRDFRAILEEAENEGLEPRIIKAVLRARKKDPDRRLIEARMTRAYMAALGMTTMELPLGAPAIGAAFSPGPVEGTRIAEIEDLRFGPKRAEIESAAPKRGRGRPKGAKNKPKMAESTAPATVAVDASGPQQAPEDPAPRDEDKDPAQYREEGKTAHAANRGPNTNPYIEGTIGAAEWEMGWIEAETLAREASVGSRGLAPESEPKFKHKTPHMSAEEYRRTVVVDADVL